MATSTTAQSSDPATPTPQMRPEGRRSHGMVALDDGRLLIVGGQTTRGNSQIWLGDTWIYDLDRATWTQVQDVAQRGQFALAHAADSSTSLLFGGYTGGNAVYEDTLVARDGRWTEVSPTTAPTGRTGSVAAYDLQSGVFVVFGGAERPRPRIAELPSNETWTYDATENVWRQMSPAASPRPASEGHPTLFELAMVYHPGVDRTILLIGGQETWAYDVDVDRWERRSDPGLRADFMVAAAYHAGLDRVIMYGGAPTSLTRETWSYDYAADEWTEVATRTRPGAVGDHAMTYDAVTDAVYLHGGSDDLIPLDTPQPAFAALWAFDGVDWRIVDG